MKNLSDHIQESFAPVKDEQQTVAENLDNNAEKVINEDENVAQEKPSE